MACGRLALGALVGLVVACDDTGHELEPPGGGYRAPAPTSDAGDAGLSASSDAAANDAHADSSTPCQERSLSACVTDDADCYVIEARPIDVEHRCLGDFVPAACETVDIMGGGAVPECLVSPVHDTWWFAQGVTLVGWDESTEFLPNGDCASLPLCGDGGSEECQERSITDCVADDGECSLIVAWPIDVENRCIGERMPVGCASVDAGEDAVVLCSVSPTGEAWFFGGSLMPPGFTPSPDFPYASAACSELLPCGDGGA